MTSSSFSQTATTDSSQILLSKPVIKLVIKDLIRYDGLKTEIIIKDSMMGEIKNNVLARDTIINKQKKVIYNLTESLSDKNKQYLEEKKISQYYIDKLNKQKQTTFLVGVGGVLLTTLTILILN